MLFVFVKSRRYSRYSREADEKWVQKKKFVFQFFYIFRSDRKKSFFVSPHFDQFLILLKPAFVTQKHLTYAQHLHSSVAGDMLPTYLSTPVVVIRRTLDSPYSEIRENFVKRFNTDTDLAQRVITGQMHKKVICNNLHKKDLAEIIAQTTLPRQISTRYIRCIAN